jgi:hypothetical protein
MFFISRYERIILNIDSKVGFLPSLGRPSAEKLHPVHPYQNGSSAFLVAADCSLPVPNTNIVIILPSFGASVKWYLFFRGRKLFCSGGFHRAGDPFFVPFGHFLSF